MTQPGQRASCISVGKENETLRSQRHRTQKRKRDAGGDLRQFVARAAGRVRIAGRQCNFYKGVENHGATRRLLRIFEQPANAGKCPVHILLRQAQPRQPRSGFGMQLVGLFIGSLSISEIAPQALNLAELVERG